MEPTSMDIFDTATVSTLVTIVFVVLLVFVAALVSNLGRGRRS